MATPHSRKNSRVFRSPDMSEAVTQHKIKVEVKEEEPNTLMDIDAEDEEAGTILMALAQDSERRKATNEKMRSYYDEKPSRSHSMSIKNLLDTDHHSMIPTQPSPYTSLSSGVISRGPSFINTASKSTPPDRRKKGFQVLNPNYFNRKSSLDNRYIYNNIPTRSFRHPSEVHVPPIKHNHSKLRRNAIHIHISYRIHAHRNHPNTTYNNHSSNSRYDHYQRNEWNSTPFHYQQDTV